MGQDANVKLNPWHPMIDPVALKTLGKLAEELGECIAAVSRCVIQGIDECDPETGVPNREWLEDEIADILAGLNLTVDLFDLNRARIGHRSGEKQIRLREWHRMA